MDLLRIAARVASRTAQQEGEGAGEMSVSQEQEAQQQEAQQQEQAQQEQVSYIKHEKGKGYCVKSPKNPDWSGGCYPSHGEAEKRLKQVEVFKHMKKGSLEVEGGDLAIVLSRNGATKVFMGGEQIGALSKLAVVANYGRLPGAHVLMSFVDGLPAAHFASLDVTGKIRSDAAALRGLPYVHVWTPEDSGE